LLNYPDELMIDWGYARRRDSQHLLAAGQGE
jgi:hypothetical protein